MAAANFYFSHLRVPTATRSPPVSVERGDSQGKCVGLLLTALFDILEALLQPNHLEEVFDRDVIFVAD